MRDEFSATRSELRTEMRALNATRPAREMRALNSETRTEMVRLQRRATRAEMVRLNDETRADMVRFNDDTRTHMRVLHEEVIGRFALIDEHLGRKRSASPRRRKPRRS